MRRLQHRRRPKDNLEDAAAESPEPDYLPAAEREACPGCRRSDSMVFFQVMPVSASALTRRRASVNDTGAADSAELDQDSPVAASRGAWAERGITAGRGHRG